MATFIGEHDGQLLFADESRAVIIDADLNAVVASGFTDVLRTQNTWSEGSFSPQAQELANSALTSLDVVVAAAGGRMYSIPKAAQNEAQKGLDWHKNKKRGGTSVGMNTARILAKGGQIGIDKMRHIAKYFPRHEVDKKGKGWSPGDDGFPSNGRIAWALWGGDAAARWASHIVETANKGAITADGYGLPGYASEDVTLEPDLDAFDEALKTTGEQGPEFIARVRMDGSGLDRLYRVDLDGTASVWDDMDWSELGEVGGDIWTYDKALDDVYDTVDTTHVIIDPESAVRLAAHFTENSFQPVSIEDLAPEEAYLAADAADDIDYELVDSTLVAAAPLPGAAPTSGDPQYTPEERAQNASKQQRDGNGKFAKVGGRVMIDKNPRQTGTITNIDSASGTATVALENGQAPVNVPVNKTTAINAQTITTPGGNAPLDPVDLSGILADPRAPIDRTLAQLPGTLPSISADDLHQLLADFPAYVNNLRKQPSAVPEPQKVKVNDDMLDIGKTGRAIEKSSGRKIILDAYDHPLLKKWLTKKDAAGRPNSMNYNPITADASSGIAVEEPAASGEEQDVTPETSDVNPIYMAVVAPDDPQAVLNLIALVPASTNSAQPMTYERKDGEWIRNEQMVNDLKSATPPPVVPLDTSTLNDVLHQVDMTQGDQPVDPAPAPAPAPPVVASISPDLVLTVLWGPDASAIVAAGGADRNRGNAEKLRRYWTVGPGGAKIMWGTGGDWTRCVRHLGKFLGTRAKGYCALRHKEMTGMWTGDKKHRMIYGRTGGNSRTFSTDYLYSESAVIASAFLRAEKAVLRNRVRGLVAAGTPEDVSPGAAFTIPLVIPENVESGDGRMFKEGAITVRDLPLPLLWQQESADGHSGSVVVGRIDSMERIEGGIGNARGVFDNGVYGREAERLVRNGFLRGVSADMDQFEAAPEEKATEMGLGDEDDKPNEIKQERLIITKSRIMAVTIVPKPAFQECSITIDGTPQSEEDDVIPDGIYVDDVDPVEASALVAAGYVASSIPLAPPSDWFSNPNLTQATPLNVDDNGHVFGHIASWQQDHIGMHNTRAPRSRSNYAYFHTGVVRTEEGSDVSVGQLTLAGGHASLEASAAQAVKHYDDTASAIADVHAGEDQFGIWVAGSLRPGAQPEQIRALRASAPSGDWRPVRGQLELVAVCQVNVPGFPVARAMVASGQVYALVAAGAMSLAKMKSDPVTELTQRLANLESSLVHKELSPKVDDVRSRFANLKAQADEAAEFKYRNLKKADRDKAAKNGTATRDGLYPIRNVEDLKMAIRTVGQAKEEDRNRVRRHVIKRARALGKGDLIPDTWKDLATIEEIAAIDSEIHAELAAKAEALSARVSKASDFAFIPKTERPEPEKPSLTASLERMRAVIAERSGESEFAAPKDLSPRQVQAERDASRIIKANNPALISDDASSPGGTSGKYTPKTQPRDEQGKFRLILARLRNDLGESGNQAVLEKIKAVENLDNTGDYKAASSAAADLYNTIDRVDKGALDSSTHATLRKATTELSKTIANLPLPFSNQAQKVRFSDLPPALREMCKRFVTNVEEKLSHDSAAKVTSEIKMFMSGAEVYSQSEVNAQLNRLLRYLD